MYCASFDRPGPWKKVSPVMCVPVWTEGAARAFSSG